MQIDIHYKELAKTLGISESYANQLISTARPWTRPLALRLYRQTGAKVGPIATATDAEIGLLERFER